VLRAQVLLLGRAGAPDAADLDAAAAALAAAREPGALPDGDPRIEADLWVALVAGLRAPAPGGEPFRAALALRRAECARGRDLPSAAFYEAIAAAVAARGDADLAVRARLLAGHMPPP
jgi:hypothetical protein